MLLFCTSLVSILQATELSAKKDDNVLYYDITPQLTVENSVVVTFVTIYSAEQAIVVDGVQIGVLTSLVTSNSVISNNRITNLYKLDYYSVSPRPPTIY